MRLQQNLELFQKRNASMMFFLSLDVSVDLRQLRLTHRERTVSFLPRKPGCVFERSRNPARRIRLQLADELRDRLVLPQFRQEMNMIGRSVYDHRDSLFVANRTSEILVRLGTDFPRQPRFTPLCRKNDVIEQIAKGGAHNVASFRRPFQGLGRSCIIPPEFRFAPFRALIPAHPSGAIASHANMKPQPIFRLCTREHATRGGVPLRSTPGFSSGAPFGCSQGNVSRACATFQSLSAAGATDYSPECSAANSGNRLRNVFKPLARGDGERVRVKRRISAGQLK